MACLFPLPSLKAQYAHFYDLPPLLIITACILLVLLPLCSYHTRADSQRIFLKDAVLFHLLGTQFRSVVSIQMWRSRRPILHSLSFKTSREMGLKGIDGVADVPLHSAGLALVSLVERF